MTPPRSGRLLVVGVSSPSLSREEEQILADLQPGGVILFGRNVDTAEQLSELTAVVRRATPRSLLCVDAEGGRVDRLRDVVGSAPSASWLAAQPTRRSEQAGRWIGYALRAFDCDVDFAPVLDLDHGAQQNALDGRYLGTRPRRVTSRGGAFLRGLHSSGVLGCVKHYPGLGAARHDTHHAPATVDRTVTELEHDLFPFRALAHAAGAVMIAHAAYPAIDASETPATLSHAIATAHLRGGLGFDGLVVSDDLEMRALDPWGDLPRRTLRALEAGCDALPICSRLAEAIEVARFLDIEAPVERIGEAASRWEAYRSRKSVLRPPGRRRYRLETVRQRLAKLG